MPIPAELSDTVWLALIGVVTLAVKQILDWGGMWVKLRLDDRRAAELKATTEAEAAKVKKALDANHNEVSSAIEVIRREGNGNQEKLVDEVRKAAYASGVKSETDKGKP